MTELKPCPFCGGEAVVVEEYLSEEADASADEITYFVSCGLCASRTDNYATKKRAIEAWNNRPNPWHTGTPTEEGWYLVKVNYDEHPYFAMKFENGSFWDYDDNDPHFVKIIPDFISMWKKIDGEKK